MFGYGGSFGYQEDANGLKLLGHRYYDPDTGRFLSPDPIGSGRNWYSYVRNNPISAADPAGLQFAQLLILHALEMEARRERIQHRLDLIHAAATEIVDALKTISNFTTSHGAARISS